MMVLRKKVACISYRYGFGGPGEALCRRVARDLVPSWIVRIISVGPWKCEVCFQDGLPVRHFPERLCEDPSPWRKGPWSPEFEAHLIEEFPSYDLVLFLETPLSMAIGSILSNPDTCCFAPLDEERRQIPLGLQNIFFTDGNRSVIFNHVEELLKYLRHVSPALFVQTDLTEIHDESSRVQHIFCELRRLVNDNRDSCEGGKSCVWR